MKRTDTSGWSVFAEAKLTPSWSLIGRARLVRSRQVRRSKATGKALHRRACATTWAAGTTSSWIMTVWSSSSRTIAGRSHSVHRSGELLTGSFFFNTGKIPNPELFLSEYTGGGIVRARMSLRAPDRGRHALRCRRGGRPCLPSLPPGHNITSLTQCYSTWRNIEKCEREASTHLESSPVDGNRPRLLRNIVHDGPGLPCIGAVHDRRLTDGDRGRYRWKAGRGGLGSGS